MAITLDQAKQLRHGEILCDLSGFGSDGMHRRWKVSGNVKLWKRDASQIRVPLKYGLYDYGALTSGHFNHEGVCEIVTRAADCNCGNR